MIKSLQTWLVEPIATIERAEDRRHARLLSALLLVVILAVMSERIFGGNIPVWILFGLFLAYGLNRYSYYPAVAMGCIFTLCVPSFLVAARMVDPNTRQLILVFMWLIVPMLLSSAFFSARVTAVIVSLCLVGMMALPLLNPLITLSILWASIGFVATSGIILLIVIRQRDLSEAERQAELEANNHALLFEVAAHKQTESALRESEEKSRQFQQKLIALQEVNIELGQIDSFDDLCRQAVLLGRSHLGFDRLGLWFRDEADPQYMVGSFGIDEQGNLRDERTLRQPAEPKNVFDITNPTDFPTKAWHKRVLYDNNHEVVGEGWSVIALLARTNQVIGIISVDNLVEKRPFSSEMLELLRLYASTLSHLIVRKQEEIKAHQRRIMLEKVVELGKQVTQVADLNECLLRIYKSVKDDLDFDRVGLFLYDQATGLLHGTYGTDREGNLVEEWDMVLAADQITPNGKPLFLSERIILVSDYQEAYGFRTEEVEKNMAGVKHHVHVVSWAGDQPVATISADNLVSQRPITEEHAEALHLFAGYAGLAIENARLLSKVQEAEQRYRSIFENAIIGIFQIARDGHVLSANPAMAHMLGYQSAQQLIDSITDFDTLIYTNADQRHAIQAYLEARQPIENYEIEVKRRDGSHAWLSQNVQIVFDDDGTPLYFEGTAQDVTDRKQIEEEREKLIQELEKRNEELERFTYTVSHDLKSPLITIQGFLGFVERDALAGNIDQLKDDMARISSATQRMQQLLDELLELSRVGRLVNPSERVPFADLVEEALGLVSGRLMQYNVQVVVEPDLPAVFVDRRRLVEVLQNLLDNAAKFMGEQPEPRVVIGVKSVGAQTLFFVQDNGVGIESIYQQRVFGLFERLDQSVEGTGIGLALVKRIIEVHNGRLWVESAGTGHGSTFYFTLPLADEQNGAAGS